MDSSTSLPRILDQVRDVVIIVTRDRQLRYCNFAAREFLSSSAFLTVRRRRLHCAVADRDTELGRIIDRVCSAGSEAAQIMVLRKPGRIPVVLLVKCLAETDGTDILLLAPNPPPDRARIVDALRACFGLTPSEAHVAAWLAEGDSLTDIAHRRDVAPGTIRSQIKTIAGKLGCTRQSQIAAIVRSVPLDFGLSPLRPV